MASTITELFDKKSVNFWNEGQEYDEFDIFDQYSEHKDALLDEVSRDERFVEYIREIYDLVLAGSRVTKIIKGGSKVSGVSDWKNHGKEMISEYLESPTIINLKKINVKIAVLEDFFDKFNKTNQIFKANHRKIRKIRNTLLVRNQRLVYSVVKKYKRDSDTEMDLLQDGCMGLVYSVDMFNHKEGLKFSTYATWWIRQYISKNLQKYDGVIKLPPNVASMIQKVRVLADKYENDNLVAKELKITVDEVRGYRSASQYSSSLNEKIGDDESSEERINLIKTEDNYEETQESINLASKALKRLDPREVKVIKMRFGIETKKEYTLEEVGQIIGVTRERARQIEKTALIKMKSVI